MIIRGASGLGDSVYLYPIINHLKMDHNDIEILSNYSDIFKAFEYSELSDITVSPFDKNRLVDIDCNYCPRKYTEGTNQFQDMCHLAGVPTDIEFRIHNKWPLEKTTTYLKRGGARICLIKSAYTPMNSAMANVKDLIPNYRKIQYLIDNFKNDHIMILVGTGEQTYKFNNIDIDLVNKTSIPETMGCVAMSDMIISQQGFMTACAEALDKKIFVLFSGNGFRSQNKFISSITPAKVITKPTSCWDTDFTHDPEMLQKFKEFING